MKIINRTIALILCLATLLSVCSCMSTQKDKGKSDDPDINVSIVDGDKDDKKDQMNYVASMSSDIVTMVQTAVRADYMALGFECSPGVAYELNNVDNKVYGLYYYMDAFDMESSNILTSCGFVEINHGSIEKTVLFDGTSDVVVEDLDPYNIDDAEMYYAYEYNYENRLFVLEKSRMV